MKSSSWPSFHDPKKKRDYSFIVVMSFLVKIRRKLRCSTLHPVGVVLQSTNDTSIILFT